MIEWLLDVYKWISVPQISPLWGILVILLVVALNLVLAFLAFLTYKLRTRLWRVVALLFVASATMHVILPHPTIRRFQDHIAFPPGDGVRLGFLVVGLVIGAYAVWRYIADHEPRRVKVKSQ